MRRLGYLLPEAPGFTVEELFASKAGLHSRAENDHCALILQG